MDSKTFQVRYGSMDAIILVGLIIISVIFGKQMISYQQNRISSKPLHTSFKIFRNCAIVSFVAAIVSYILYIIYRLDTSFPDQTRTKIFRAGDIFLCINRLTFLFFEICRLYFTFDLTVYGINNYTMVLLTGMLLFALTSWILALIYGVYGIYFFIHLAVVIILPLIVACLFTNKLFKLLLSMTSTETVSSPGTATLSGNYGIDTNDVRSPTYNSETNTFSYSHSYEFEQQLNPAQESSLNIIAKQTILACLQSFAASMQCLVVYYWFFRSDTSNIDYVCDIVYIIATLLWHICLWLTFKFANQDYKKMCGKLHASCLKWFRASAINKLTNITIMDQEKELVGVDYQALNLSIPQDES